MGGYHTYFAEYAPYPFAAGVNLEIYKEIFKDYLTIEIAAETQTEQPKKKCLFGIGRR